jgi:hypothetical protein
LAKSRGITISSQDKAEKDGQVFVKVQTDAILPCEIDIQSDNQTFLTYTWTQGSVFLFTAKKVQENVTLTYLLQNIDRSLATDTTIFRCGNSFERKILGIYIFS